MMGSKKERKKIIDFKIKTMALPLQMTEKGEKEKKRIHIVTSVNDFIVYISKIEV